MKKKTKKYYLKNIIYLAMEKERPREPSTAISGLTIPNKTSDVI